MALFPALQARRAAPVTPPGWFGAFGTGMRSTPKTASEFIRGCNVGQTFGSSMFLAATFAYVAKMNGARTLMSARGRSGAARGDGGHDRGTLQAGPFEAGLSSLKAFTRKIVNLKNRRRKLEDELNHAQYNLAMRQASAQEMILALEEEMESERQAKDLIGRQFLQISSKYNKLNDRFELEQLKSTQQYEALQARLQNSMAEQRKAQSMATSFQKKLARLDKQVRDLQLTNQDLAAQLRKANTVKDDLQKEVAEQSALISELLELQAASQNDNQKLRKENLELKKQLELAERSLALLLDPSEGSQ